MQPTLVAHTCLSAAWCCTCCPTLMSPTPSFATSCTPATTAAQTLHPCYVAALTATPARFSFRVVAVRRRAWSGGFDSRSQGAGCFLTFRRFCFTFLNPYE